MGNSSLPPAQLWYRDSELPSQYRHGRFAAAVAGRRPTQLVDASAFGPKIREPQGDVKSTENESAQNGIRHDGRHIYRVDHRYPGEF
jgi:hypothetical protein